MVDKPTTASGYRRDYVESVKGTCLYIATKLGDLSEDLVVVGGLAPSLLIDQEDQREGVEKHVGTLDLDVGLAVALLNKGRYRTLAERLRRAGFSQDMNLGGNPTLQRWKIEQGETVTVDFLIAPTDPSDEGGKTKHVEPDLAAFIIPGLHLAFEDQLRVTVSGKTILGEEATREVSVCGPGAYLVLKALAFDSRGENKDAYDLFYVVRNYGDGVADVARRLEPLLEDPTAQRAIEVLRRDFTGIDSVGGRRVAKFLTEGPDDTIQADVVGFVGELLRRF